MPGAHAEFPPSGATRWLPCAASSFLSRGVPERDGEESREGVRVHSVVDSALKTGLKSVEDQDDVAYEAAELVYTFVKKLGPGSVQSELKAGFPHIPEVWGTVDVVHETDASDVLTIVDYKNGAMDVQAVENKQMLTYAAMRHFSMGKRFKWARLVIIQPNSRTAGETEPVKQWFAPAARLEQHADEVANAVKRAYAGEAPNPGKHCRYCPAFGNCPATKKVVALLEHVLEMPVDQVPDASIVRVLQVLRGVEDYKKMLGAELMRRLQSGRPVPNAELGPTASHRKWKDDILAAKALHEAYGAGALDPVSPAKAEKLGPEGKRIAGLLAYKPTGGVTAVY